MKTFGVLSSLLLLGVKGTEDDEAVSMLQSKLQANNREEVEEQVEDEETALLGSSDEDLTDLSHLSARDQAAIADFYKKGNCKEACEEFRCGPDCSFFECDGEWCDAGCNCGFTMKELEATGCPGDCKHTPVPKKKALLEDYSVVEEEMEQDETESFEDVVEDTELSEEFAREGMNTTAGWGGRRRRRWFSWPARRRAPSCTNNCRASSWTRVHGSGWTGYVMGTAPTCGGNPSDCRTTTHEGSSWNGAVSGSGKGASGSVSGGGSSSKTYEVQTVSLPNGQASKWADGGASCWTGTKQCCCNKLKKKHVR